jgi:hypothetical protein
MSDKISQRLRPSSGKSPGRCFDELPAEERDALGVEDQEDDALDANIRDKTEWPSHLNVTIKETSLKVRYLCDWLTKNGHEHEAGILAEIGRVSVA